MTLKIEAGEISYQTNYIFVINKITTFLLLLMLLRLEDIIDV